MKAIEECRKPIGLLALTIFFAAFGAVSSLNADHHRKGDIVDVAAEAGSFSTLLAAVKAAGLAETLRGEGPFTVFAPTDEAFAKLPDGTVQELLKPENKARLQAILTCHVVAGKVTSDKVIQLDRATTVQGKDVTVKVKSGKVMVDNATVVTADIMASNGVIHVIDNVILPGS